MNLWSLVFAPSRFAHGLSHVSFLVIAATVPIAVPCNSVQAEVLYSTFGPGYSYVDDSPAFGVLGASQSPPNMSRYELFTMSTSGKLAVAKLAASKYAEWAEGLILMEIFTNDGSTSTPSSLLATLSFNFNSVTPSVATAYLSDGPVLTAGSSYWLGYRAGSPLSALALYRNSLGITVADRIDDNGVIHTGLSSAAAVELSAVPEPSTYAMALAGLACGGYSMWRRRKRA